LSRRGTKQCDRPEPERPATEQQLAKKAPSSAAHHFGNTIPPATADAYYVVPLGDRPGPGTNLTQESVGSAACRLQRPTPPLNGVRESPSETSAPFAFFHPSVHGWDVGANCGVWFINAPGTLTEG